MRELKFRAWFENVQRGREVNGELVFGIESYYDYDPIIDNNGLLDVEAGWDIQGHSDEKYVIEQYTGLKDKNGKEIYEGDIVENTYQYAGKVRYVVKWDCGRFIMICDNPANLVQIGMGIYPKSSEVIGNIHENPELLEGEK